MIIGLSGKIKSGKDTVASMIQYLDSLSVSEKHDLSVREQLKEGFDPELWYDETTQWKRKYFAGKLKQIVSLLTGIPASRLNRQDVKNKPLGKEWDLYTVYSDGGVLRLSNEEKALKSMETFGLRWRDGGIIKTARLKRQQMTPRRLLQLLGTEAGRQIIHPNIWVNALFADWKTDHPSTPYQKWIICDVRFPNEAEAIKKRGGVLVRIERPDELRFPDKKADESVLSHASETALDNWQDWDYTITNNGTLKDLEEKVAAVFAKI